LLQLLLGEGEVSLHILIIRSHPEDGPELIDRLPVPPLPSQDAAEIGVSLGQIGIDPECGAELPAGLFQVSRGSVNQSEIQDRLRVIGL